MEMALYVGMSAGDFWESTPRAVLLLARAKAARMGGSGKAAGTPKEAPKLNRIPR